MSAFTLARADALLQGIDTGRGALAVVFQHGLGGSDAQVTTTFPGSPAYRRLTLECRAQGRSTPGTERPFSIGMFADDVLAACDARGIGRFVAGGISMGAAIALRLAVRHPERVHGLILARPAWLFDAAPENMRPYREVAHALRAFPAGVARVRFAASQTAQVLAREAPDNLVSLLGFFESPDPAVTADLLEAIAADGPGVSRAEAAALHMPTLVVGHGVDHAHPLAFAQDLARTIPGALLAETPPKATQPAKHAAAFRDAVDSFLKGLGAAGDRHAGPTACSHTRPDAQDMRPRPPLDERSFGANANGLSE